MAQDRHWPLLFLTQGLDFLVLKELGFRMVLKGAPGVFPLLTPPALSQLFN